MLTCVHYIKELCIKDTCGTTHNGTYTFCICAVCVCDIHMIYIYIYLQHKDIYTIYMYICIYMQVLVHVFASGSKIAHTHIGPG